MSRNGTADRSAERAALLADALDEIAEALREGRFRPWAVDWLTDKLRLPLRIAHEILGDARPEEVDDGGC